MGGHATIQNFREETAFLFSFFFYDFATVPRSRTNEAEVTRADNDILARRYPEIITTYTDARKAG